MIGDGFTFIEEKGSLPQKNENLELEIQNILEYSTEHSFEGPKFVPQVVLLGPEDIYEERRKLLRGYQRKLPTVSYPYPVEDPIIFKKRQGQINESETCSHAYGRREDTTSPVLDNKNWILTKRSSGSLYCMARMGNSLDTQSRLPN